ncbi:hypothetical protein [Actinophytocola sp. KF-1]
MNEHRLQLVGNSIRNTAAARRRVHAARRRTAQVRARIAASMAQSNEGGGRTAN